MPVKVSSAQELVEAVNTNPNAEIKLTDNINVSAFGTIAKTFSGTIDGRDTVNGRDTIYTIYKDKKYSLSYVPLFGEMKDAKIRNLVVSGFRVQSDDDNNMGALAYTMNGCSLENITLYQISVFTDEDYAGSIAGTATNCHFNNIKCMSCDVTTDGIGAGGLVGWSKSCKFTQCMFNQKSWVFSDGTAIVPNSAYAGGISGLSENDTFEYCYNFGIIGGNDDAVAGVTGHSTGSTFSYCVNSGCVFQVDEETFHSSLAEIQKDVESKIRDNRVIWVSGFSAVMFGSPAIIAVPFWITTSFPPLAVATAAGVAIIGTAMTIYGLMQMHDELAGISGSANGGAFDCCYNYGTCMARDMYIGGIVGLAENGVKINNCLNAGHVQGSSTVGGIAGLLKASQMTNCLNVGSVKADYENEEKRESWSYLFVTESGDNNSSWNNNYFKFSSYDPVSGGRVKVTEKQLASGEVAWWLNQGQENGPWRQNIGEDLNPVVDPEHLPVTHNDLVAQIRIKSARELKDFAQAVNNRSDINQTYVVFLDADIDLEGEGNWIPIGTQEKPFYGLFFGGGHTIDNLQCQVSTANIDAGLFGTLGMRSEIHDVNLGSHSSISSINNAAGGIAGCVRVPDGNIGAVRISGCTNQASVSGKYNVGGILGAVYFDTKLRLSISDCCNAGVITATGTNGAVPTGESAVICGYSKNNAVISRCWNVGPLVSGTSAPAYKTGYSFVYGENPQLTDCYDFEGYITEKSAQKGVESYSAMDYVDGTLCFNLNGKTNDTRLGLRWQQEIGEGSYPVYTGFGSQGKGIYLSNRTSDKTGMIVLPYDVTSSDSLFFCVLDSVKYQGDDSFVQFKHVDVLPAGTPALFHSNVSDFDFISTGGNFDNSRIHTVEVHGMSMSGTFTDLTVHAADAGPLYRYEAGLLKQSDDNLDIKAFGTYFTNQSSTDIPTFYVTFINSLSEHVTSAKPVKAYGEFEIDRIYDIHGRQITDFVPGVNILKAKDGRTSKIILRK